jgi:STE24 endopeptidase
MQVMPSVLQQIAYAHATCYLSLFEKLTTIGVLLLFVDLRLSSRLRSLIEIFVKPSAVVSACYVASLATLIDMCQIPTVIINHLLRVHYLQRVERWPHWWFDFTIARLTYLVIACAILAALRALIVYTGRRWWLYAWSFLVIYSLGAAYVNAERTVETFGSDAVVDQRPELKQAVVELIAHSGVHISPQQIVDSGQKGGYFIAKTSILWGSKRVVVAHDAVEGMPSPSILFAVAHELGHGGLLEQFKGCLVTAGVWLVCFFLASIMIGASLVSAGMRWDIRGAKDCASLPLFVLSLLCMLACARLLINAYQRHEELRVDRIAVESLKGIVPNPRNIAAHFFEELIRAGSVDPAPNWLVKIWCCDDPPVQERIARLEPKLRE